MIRIARTTNKLTSKEAVDKAVEYFGAGGLGMEMTERADCCVHFLGAGGHVRVTTSEQPDGKIEVEVESKEWDYDAKKFLEQI